MTWLTCSRASSWARTFSLAFIDPAYAEEGTELTVIWGPSTFRQKEIRATVAQFPYYQGEWRNETCDVNELVPPFEG